MNYIIFFCCLIAEPDGYIAISEDTVQAFGVTWQITDAYWRDFYGDQIYDASFKLKYENIEAYLIINGKHVNFVIPKVKNIRFKQLPHETRYYEKYGL